MTPAAARPYLRYAATEPLRASRSQRSLAGWASSQAAPPHPSSLAECPDDLFDYAKHAEPRRASRRSRKDDGPIVVTDDWPEQVPIGDAELRAIEGHMRQDLDKLFGPLP